MRFAAGETRLAAGAGTPVHHERTRGLFWVECYGNARVHRAAVEQTMLIYVLQADEEHLRGVQAK